MLCTKRKTTIAHIAAVFIAAVFVAAGVFAISLSSGGGYVFAEVGSIEDGEDIQYDKTQGLLSSLGFDTSKMPSTYDPDKTTNPYGSNVSTLNEVEEMVLLSTSEPSSHISYHSNEHIIDPENISPSGLLLFGHQKKLDGSLDTLKDRPQNKNMDFLADQAFVATAKCDINGDGRDSVLAVVYTKYQYSKDDPLAANSEDRNIYLQLYSPAQGAALLSEPVVISKITGNDIRNNFLVQSQLQIAAGDFDKDNIDEIAVYSPAKSKDENARVKIFDLVDENNPFINNSWRLAWNYILPISNDKIVHKAKEETAEDTDVYIRNIYNNVDLASGDADNDGICDLIISYGASDTDYYKNDADLLRPGFENIHKGIEQEIKRSIPSKSVLLYGSDRGQMLKDEEDLSYDDNELIRVSYAFGDVDGDGNEDMFIGGQLRSEQSENISRVLGKYIYDKNSKDMELEQLNNLKVVDGKWERKDKDDSDSELVFSSANGWDGNYNSVPLMTTNLTIGNLLGSQSDNKIYLDSVLYSYDGGTFEIADELEDNSMEPYGDESPTMKKYKGSHPLDDIEGYYGDANATAAYFEYGADSGNFTGGLTDYMLVNRVTIPRTFRKTGDLYETHPIHNAVTLLKQSDIDSSKIQRNVNYAGYNDQYKGAQLILGTTDSDIDSMVATYTGHHEIDYQKPKILAVLASAPYFKDVAAYDDHMLDYCRTSYGKSEGNTSGHMTTYSDNVGAFVNTEFGGKVIHGIINAQLCRARSESWGYNEERNFTISFDTGGGEDAVVLYSTPVENYLYKVEGVTVDDDGNTEPSEQLMVLSDQHKPVTQTIAMEDYIEIQKHNKGKLVDVSKYLTSTPGEPGTYPKNENDIPKEAKDNLWGSETSKEYAGISYGTGTVSQSITYSKETYKEGDNKMDGVSGTVEVGVGHTFGDPNVGGYFTLNGGFHFDFQRVEGDTKTSLKGVDCSGMVSNMPRAAKGYGYDFSWKLFKFEVNDGSTDPRNDPFPIITYIVDDVLSPPELPANLAQDFENTTDSQIALTWTYNRGEPQSFEIYRYEDFPQGGGEKLVGTVDGGDYRIRKDENGNTMRDKDGNVIKDYSFIETGLTADTKYQYRMKVKRAKAPFESIFSPVCEARTDVGTKPQISLSADKLHIYPDGTYDLFVELADPENYQSDISYQWQKYNEKSRKWEDFTGRERKKLHFYSCEAKDAGTYRCRVNLVRKRESSPQYITTFTNSCKVTFSLRDVRFGDISVFSGQGSSQVNTGLKVSVFNASQSSLEKPIGEITFKLKGPNGTFKISKEIDEATGEARIDSIEDMLSSEGKKAFVDGGYVITASYGGSRIFYPADDPEEYHYLRNIDECIFLSTRSEYEYGDDIIPSTELSDYKKDRTGKVTRTDLTDKLTKIRFYSVDENGDKADLIIEYNVAEGEAAKVPMSSAIANKKKAYVEAFMQGSDEPAAHSFIKVSKRDIDITVNEKLTGTGDLLEFVSSKDVEFSGGVDPKEKNIFPDTGTNKQSLEDNMLYKYYEQNGEFMYDSEQAPAHKDAFVPASYRAEPSFKEGAAAKKYYDPKFKDARFMVVGNYYLVSASAKDPNTGRVKMILPDQLTDFENKGYAGGTKLTLKAVPNKGYEVRSWIVKECGNEEYTLKGSEKIDYLVKSQNTDGTGEITIKAVMAPKDNKLTYGKKGKGTISVDPSVSSGAAVLADTKLTFTATPDKAAGWHFEEWRWSNDGGSNAVSDGMTSEDGTNTKSFTMPDNSVDMNAIFARDTIDIEAASDLEVSYINEDGNNPNYDDGEEVVAEKGRGVPKGSKVIVKTKPGIELAPESEWVVEETNPDGPVDVDVTEKTYNGREGCEFTLDEDVTKCKVSASTVKGKYTVTAAADHASFSLKVDGNATGTTQGDGSITVNGIESGAQIDINAKVERGWVIDKWIVNGEEKNSDDDVYITNITENLNVTVETKQDQAVQLSLATDGGGTARYVIKGKDGETADTDSFKASADTPKTVQAYKGESVSFGVDDSDKAHTMTAIFVDGEQQDIEDSEYTISELKNDTSVLVRFGSNIHHEATFTKDWRTKEPVLLDEDKAEVDDGKLMIPDGGTLKFYVTQDKDLKCVAEVRTAGSDDPFTVLESGNPVQTTDTTNTYYFEVSNIRENKELRLRDYNIIYITDEDKFYEYMYEVRANSASAAGQPDGVLMNDITLTESKCHEKLDNQTPGDNYSKFIGNGHKISGVKIGTEEHPVVEYHGLFGNLMKGAAVSDVHIDGLELNIRGALDNSYTALLADDNRGTMENVALTGAKINSKKFGTGEQAMAAPIVCGLAKNNYGIIRDCMVSGLTITTDAAISDAGAAGVFRNMEETSGGETVKGLIEGNYFEDLKVKGSGSSSGEPELAAEKIVVFDTVNEGGDYNKNYYKAVYDIDNDGQDKPVGTADAHGISVYTLTDKPFDRAAAEAEAGSPGFAGKIAYNMNRAAEKEVWGIPAVSGSGMQPILQLAVGGKDEQGNSKYMAPVKVDYAATQEKTLTTYIAPGAVKLPGEEVFGEDTPDAWNIGDAAYSPGVTVMIEDDTFVTGIRSTEDYVAKVKEYNSSSEATGTIFFKTLDAAAKAVMARASSDQPPHRQKLDIIGNCELTTDFDVDAKTVVTVCEGKTLTISNSATITNKGSIEVEEADESTGAAKATVHKYGVIENENSVTIPAGCTFYNYGTKFPDKVESASVADRANIICKPHVCGKWEYADKPETEGEHAGQWKKTSTCEVCEKEVTDYEDPNPPVSKIKNIEILQEPDKTVYEVGDKFTDEGLIVVANMTDGSKAVITRGEGGYTLALKTGSKEEELKNGDELNEETSAKVIVKYGSFSADFDIEILDTANLLSVTDGSGADVTEEGTGKGIEMKPEDTAVLNASLKKKVPFKTKFRWDVDNEAIAGLKTASGKENTVTAGDPGKAEITVTVTDEQDNPIQSIRPKHVEINNISHITDLSIIGGDIYINKGQSKEIKLDITPKNTSDTVEWSTDDKDIAQVDPQGFITGFAGGVTKVTVKSPGGITDTRKVYVNEKALSLMLVPETLSIRKDGFGVISARAMSETANGEVEWSLVKAIADEDAPAGFYVKNEKTGEMEIKDTVKTKLSGDGMDYSDTYVIVAGVKEGTVTVKARTPADGNAEGAVDGMLEKTCQVTVEDTPDVYVSITHNGAVVSGQTMTLDLEGKYLNLGAISSEENDTFTWSVMDDDISPVLKVDNTGKVTLRRSGTAAVKVKSDITDAIDVCMLKVVVVPKSIALSDSEKTLKKGEHYTLKATLTPEDAEAKIKWTSSNTKIATVSDEGRITAVAKGVCMITADPDVEGVEPATCKVTVTEEPKPDPPKPDPPKPDPPKPDPQPTDKANTPLAKITAKGKTTLVVTWGKVKGAEGYDIYFAKCNSNCKKIKLKKVKTVKAGKKLKCTMKKLAKKKPYKFQIKAWAKKNGKKKIIARSPVVHAYTANGNKKYTNVKKVKIKKKKVTVKVGKTYKIKAKIVKYKKKKKLMSKKHAPVLRYMSSDPAVATVSKKGKIKGKSKGKCDVFVFAVNGAIKTVKVTVK